jgi:hypothetical protein
MFPAFYLIKQINITHCKNYIPGVKISLDPWIGIDTYWDSLVGFH